MHPDQHCKTFLLRLPLSVRERAAQLAHSEGTSLNHFISLAVAEKIARLDLKESDALRTHLLPSQKL